ncbi:MAG: transketolase, partial [Chloroflexota bacterium]
MTTEPTTVSVPAEEIARLEEMARRIRVAVIRTVTDRKVGHVGGPLSAADILAALYGHILRIRPQEPDWPERDRFILSKGHSALGQYAAMALAGYFDVEELYTFNQKGSRLQGHPDMNKL